MQGSTSIRLSMFSILKAFVIQLHPLRKLLYRNASRILFLIMQIKVELIDIEPQDLINRLNTGNVYRQTQEKQAVENFFLQ